MATATKSKQNEWGEWNGCRFSFLIEIYYSHMNRKSEISGSIAWCTWHRFFFYFKK